MLRSTLKITLVLVASAFAAGSALAVDTVTTKDAPELAPVRAKIDAKDWTGAVADLKKLATTYQHADVYNLLGYSLRNLGDYGQAKTYYAKALDFDPGHKGAHEYLGELYLKTGEMDKAKAMLAKLEKLCPTGCEELADLKGDIAEAEAKSAAKTN
jgi:Flp pilus assembly protein TadD